MAEEEDESTQPQTCNPPRKKSQQFLHLHSKDMHAIKTVGFVAITEENTHEGGWVMSDSTCVYCLELVSTCAGFFEMTWLERRGKWGCRTAFSRDKRGSLEPLLVVELLWCGRIWRPNSTDLILIWSWSNQSVRWIQSGVSTVIPLQRKKHYLEMIQGTNAEHTLQRTHRSYKQKSAEHHRGG